MSLSNIMSLSCRFGERMCKVSNKPGNFPNFVANFVALYAKNNEI